MVNKDLIHIPRTPILGFKLPILNRFRTNQGRCAEAQNMLIFEDSEKCEYKAAK